MMKRFFALLSCLVVMPVAMTSPAYADYEGDYGVTDYEDYYYDEYVDDDTIFDEDYYASDYNAKVVDSYGLLEDYELQNLEDKIQELSEEYDFDCVINIVSYYSGMDLSYYADNFYHDNYYNDDGIIFVVSMGTREWWFLQFGEGKDYISDSYGLEWLEFKVIDELSDDEYYECFDQFVDSVYAFVEEAKDNKPYSAFHQKLDGDVLFKKAKDYFPILFVMIIIGVVIVVAIGKALIKQMKTVKMQPNGNNYLKNGSFKLHASNDVFSHTHTTRIRVKSSGSGGRGGSRGGRGGRF